MPANRPEGLQTRTASNKIVATTLDELGISSKLTTEQTTALGRRSVENEPELKNIRPKKIPALHLKPDEQMYDDMMAIMELLGMKNNKTMTIRMALSNYRQQLEKEKGSRWFFDDG